MREFRKLKVWEKAHKFVLEIYNLANGFVQRDSIISTFAMVGSTENQKC